ncbi:hypothetical protein AB6H27_22155 [Providencia huaxiensis]|uniref:hypothetical protein n=1 Tax=Providencia TaxID=586 RepID=UPI0034DD5DD5
MKLAYPRTKENYILKELRLYALTEIFVTPPVVTGDIYSVDLALLHIMPPNNHFKDESKIACLKHSYTHGEKVSPLSVSVVIVDGLPKLAVMDGFQRYCALMEIVAEGGQIEGVDVKEA